MDKKTKKVGELRRVDELGRVIIPSKIRQEMGLSFGSMVEFFRLSDSQILIKKNTSNFENLKKIWQILNCFKTEDNLILLFDQNGAEIFLKKKIKTDFLQSHFLNRQKADILLSSSEKNQIGFLYCHFVPIFLANQCAGYFVVFDNCKIYTYKPILYVLEAVFNWLLTLCCF